MDNGASSYLRFLNGENDAFAELIRQYKDGLVLFINTFACDIHIAEEAADETFLKLYVRRPRYNGACSFKTWLYTIGKNTALNYLKKRSRQSSRPLEDYYYISDETDIESDYIKGEQNIILHQALGALGKDYSQVLYLIYFEGLTAAEAARITGRTSRQVSDLIYRAKKALRAELERRGFNGQI
ncbi:MAG: RNA polymerase sigma factor [Ruminococcus sp.]|nr:RNA polymerase sigma factor [Ruminococcus sp.]